MIESTSGAPQRDAGNAEAFFKRLGQLTRMLRDSMRDMGLQQEVEEAAKAIPDARERLSYVANMTEKAAERALNAVDRAQPIQSDIEAGAKDLNERWGSWLDNAGDHEQGKALAQETRQYLGRVEGMTKATTKELLEIIMAQDFQDLTGQVIKKMMVVIQEVERQLLDILLDSVSNQKDRDDLRQKMIEQWSGGVAAVVGASGASLLNGPQVALAAADDVVSSQDQVDDLLDELGF